MVTTRTSSLNLKRETTGAAVLVRVFFMANRFSISHRIAGVFRAIHHLLLVLAEASPVGEDVNPCAVLSHCVQPPITTPSLCAADTPEPAT